MQVYNNMKKQRRIGAQYTNTLRQQYNIWSIMKNGIGAKQYREAHYWLSVIIVYICPVNT